MNANTSQEILAELGEYPRLRVYHISNPPGKAFCMEVDSVGMGMVLLQALAKYDVYLDDAIHPNAISSNVSGLQYYNTKGNPTEPWEEWYNSEGEEIWDVIKEIKSDDALEAFAQAGR